MASPPGMGAHGLRVIPPAVSWELVTLRRETGEDRQNLHFYDPH